VFDKLKSRWAWRAIPHCPGRFVLASGPSGVSPSELLGPAVDVTEHVVPAADDPVLVARFRDGGLISYRKPNGTYVHTLNTADGLDRKLQQLGIW
jgi:phage baseplate assembly protein gpV